MTGYTTPTLGGNYNANVHTKWEFQKKQREAQPSFEDIFQNKANVDMKLTTIATDTIDLSDATKIARFEEFSGLL